jgi:alpha-glucosidase (family GH31 glycosyl hydrolase)
VATIDMDWHWTDVIQRFGKEAVPGEARSKQEQFFNRFMPGWTGYSWNTELFPDHCALLDWLHDQGFKVTLNVHPSQGIRFFEDCYEKFCQRMGIDPESKALIPFDVADTKFMEAYFDVAHHCFEEEGVDFWWLDWQQGKTSNIPGLDPLWALNHYHTLDHGREKTRPLILSRYAGLGSHRYPLGFSGDTHCTWASLDFQPYFTNNAANAGYTWWSHDIGGHQFGVQDDELYLRWLQYGVFSPINRLHSTCSDYMGKEPWKRSFAVQMVSENFLRLRHRLIPYLYSANYRTHTEGIPICMPMYYEYDCEDAYSAKNQYIFGSQLLVCPITKPADKRLNLASSRVWLPEGRWTDIFNGRIYRGGCWVNLYRDLDSIPVLARAGAIVPMYESGDTNSLSLEQPLEINVWRGDGRFELYEDDGETNAYRSGKYAITTFEVSEDECGIHFVINAPVGDVSILPKERKFTIRFRDLLDEQGREVVVPVIFTGAKFQLHLSDLVPAVNAGEQELRTELLTRIQGSNQWKSMVFSKRMPGFIQDALDELKHLV